MPLLPPPAAGVQGCWVRWGAGAGATSFEGGVRVGDVVQQLAEHLGRGVTKGKDCELGSVGVAKLQGAGTSPVRSHGVRTWVHLECRQCVAAVCVRAGLHIRL